MLDIVDSTSIDCAREIRGIASSDNPVARRAFSAAKSSGWSPSPIRAMTAAPLRSRAISSGFGSSTLTMTSLAHTWSDVAMVAPAAR